MVSFLLSYAVCAAPGSKTFQLLEMIHQSTKPGMLPNALVCFNIYHKFFFGFLLVFRKVLIASLVILPDASPM
jgi:16S rRNA C967 or C1407 C5-methylase (RsmB/RsmF family)